jgi:hypothetical protein
MTALGHVGVITDTGRRRRRNEDAYVCGPPLFAIADGMGGAQAGEVASRLAAAALKESGAERVIGCSVHPVLSGPAIERMEQAPLEQLVVTDTIPLDGDARLPKIHVLSVARLLGQAIRSIHEETSVSSLFV